MRAKRSIRVSRSAWTWKKFFEALSGKRADSTEVYVATFSESFNLAKAPYQLGDRIVML